MIDFEISLKFGHGANAVDTGITVLGTFETSFGRIIAINLDNGPTIYPSHRGSSGDIERLANTLAAQLSDRYRDAIDAEHEQQVRDVAETHPYRAARNRVYADLMGIPAL